MVDRDPVSGLQRRVAGFHDIRLDGISDLVFRASGATVLDVGCNRGLVGFELAQNGARLVHGCDNFADGIHFARQLFADLRYVRSQFEIVDLAEGPSALDVFDPGEYDIVLVLATFHKLGRIMARDDLEELMFSLGRRASKFFGWRSTERNDEANELELSLLDKNLEAAGLVRVQYSTISDLGPAAIWERPKR